MALPKVTIRAAAGDVPEVTVDGVDLPGVRSAQIHVTQDRAPQIALVLAADSVDAELPAGVQVLRTGQSVAEFAAALNPARLEGLALQHMEMHDGTTGEAFAAAVALMAAEFDQSRD